MAICCETRTGTEHCSSCYFVQLGCVPTTNDEIQQNCVVIIEYLSTCLQINLVYLFKITELVWKIPGFACLQFLRSLMTLSFYTNNCTTCALFLSHPAPFSPLLQTVTTRALRLPPVVAMTSTLHLTLLAAVTTAAVTTRRLSLLPLLRLAPARQHVLLEVQRHPHLGGRPLCLSDTLPRLRHGVNPRCRREHVHRRRPSGRDVRLDRPLPGQQRGRVDLDGRVGLRL